jgi:hypothetical protein
MATVIAGMTMSVDGFVADPNGSVGRLYPDLPDLRGSAFMNALIEEAGAVVMGRRAFEMGDLTRSSASMSSRCPSSYSRTTRRASRRSRTNASRSPS